MKTILCYGDSNTYGYIPADGGRYPKQVRWTCLLQNLLGPDYCVVDEGCNGRTTIFPMPEKEWLCGLYGLEPILYSHKPIDQILLMLGTNDQKLVIGKTTAQIADGIGVIIDRMKTFLQTANGQGFVPDIVLMAPPLIGPCIAKSPYVDEFGLDSHERSKAFAKEYERVAKEKGVRFLDAAKYTTVSDADSIHLDEASHAALAKVLYEICK